MKTKNKRLIFTEDEKSSLRSAVLKRRDVIENRKTDAVSIVQKNACWEEVADEFNSHHTYVKRTTAQLKKLWDNIKFRRKTELGLLDKRERVKTGESYTSILFEDPDLECNGIDVELQDSADSNTIFRYGNDSNKIMNKKTADEPDTSLGTSRQPSPDPLGCSFAQTPVTGQKRTRGTDQITGLFSENEESLRRRRNLQFMKHDEELQELKVKEQKLKIQLLENQLLYEKELFELRKKEIMAKLTTLDKS